MEKIEELAQTITDLAESNPEQCVLLLEAIARKRQDIPDAHQATVSYKKMPDGTIREIQIILIKNGYEQE